MLRRLALLSALVLCIGCGGPENTDVTLQVTLQDIDVEGLMADIKAQKGKVVVVDVWGIFCPPCRKEFPGLVALHEKYVKQGLVAMSVSVDIEDDRADAHAFLKKHRATFANYFTGAEKDRFMVAWGIEGVPTVVVFDRDGKPVARMPGVPYSHVEKIVQKLL